VLSVVTAAHKDSFLQKTVDDIRAKFIDRKTEIIVVLDGYHDDIKGADKVIESRRRQGLRPSFNAGFAAATGDWLMKTDSHCLFDEAFDDRILSHTRENWVIVPRRYHLDMGQWRRMDELGYVDYDRLIIDRPDKLSGVYWTQRKERRAHIPVDETMVFQGSCYVLSREHWEKIGPLQVEGYGTFAQEPIEVALKTWLGGGKVMVNKRTWYAHKHRKFKRCASPNKAEVEAGNKYSQDFWLNDRWEGRVHDLRWLMRRFGLRWKNVLNPD